MTLYKDGVPVLVYVPCLRCGEPTEIYGLCEKCDEYLTHVAVQELKRYATDAEINEWVTIHRLEKK